MSPTRLNELRQALGFVRTARARLREGKLSEAFRYHANAVQQAAFIRGVEAISAVAENRSVVRAVDCTATLRRVVAEQGFQIEAAIRAALAPRAPADVASVIDLMAEGVRVLVTRDGVDLTDEQVIERARNLATTVLCEFEVFERAPATYRTGVNRATTRC
jgi:hypothetical protein